MSSMFSAGHTMYSSIRVTRIYMGFRVSGTCTVSVEISDREALQLSSLGNHYVDTLMPNRDFLHLRSHYIKMANLIDFFFYIFLLEQILCSLNMKIIRINTLFHQKYQITDKMQIKCITLKPAVLLYKSGVHRGLNYIGVSSW